MPRTTLTKTQTLGAFGTYSANAADVTMTAADVANLNQFAATSTNLVLAHNGGVGAATITITSAPDEKGRTGDIAAYSLGAGEYAVFGPFDSQRGWRQADGYVYLQASSADIKLGVIEL